MCDYICIYTYAHNTFRNKKSKRRGVYTWDLHVSVHPLCFCVCCGLWVWVWRWFFLSVLKNLELVLLKKFKIWNTRLALLQVTETTRFYLQFSSILVLAFLVTCVFPVFIWICHPGLGTHHMLLILSTCPVLDTSVNGGGVRLYQTGILIMGSGI